MARSSRWLLALTLVALACVVILRVQLPETESGSPPIRPLVAQSEPQTEESERLGPSATEVPSATTRRRALDDVRFADAELAPAAVLVSKDGTSDTQLVVRFRTPDAIGSWQPHVILEPVSAGLIRQRGEVDGVSQVRFRSSHAWGRSGLRSGRYVLRLHGLRVPRLGALRVKAGCHQELEVDLNDYAWVVARLASRGADVEDSATSLLELYSANGKRVEQPLAWSDERSWHLYESDSAREWSSVATAHLAPVPPGRYVLRTAQSFAADKQGWSLQLGAGRQQQELLFAPSVRVQSPPHLADDLAQHVRLISAPVRPASGPALDQDDATTLALLRQPTLTRARGVVWFGDLDAERDWQLWYHSESHGWWCSPSLDCGTEDVEIRSWTPQRGGHLEVRLDNWTEEQRKAVSLTVVADPFGWRSQPLRASREDSAVRSLRELRPTRYRLVGRRRHFPQQTWARELELRVGEVTRVTLPAQPLD